MILWIGFLYLTFALFAMVAVGIRSKWLYGLLAAVWAAALPMRFLGNIWVLGLSSALVAYRLWRDWATVSPEERVFRMVMLAGAVDSVANWIAIFMGLPPTQISLHIGECYRIGQSNLFWCLLALTLLILLFRRGARERHERERLAGELAAASAIQRLLLAQPALVDRGLSLEATYLPAQEVGGDFYLVIGGEVLLAGDVPAKG